MWLARGDCRNCRDKLRQIQRLRQLSKATIGEDDVRRSPAGMDTYADWFSRCGGPTTSCRELLILGAPANHFVPDRPCPALKDLHCVTCFGTPFASCRRVEASQILHRGESGLGHNWQKRADDDEMISDQELWSVIRYLDPELDRRANDFAVIIAILAIVSIVCVVYLSLHFRGL